MGHYVSQPGMGQFNSFIKIKAALRRRERVKSNYDNKYNFINFLQGALSNFELIICIYQYTFGLIE